MMGRRGKKVEPDEAQGAPEWMVTFSDCMTLLLTFFVLLLSFSSFDINIFWRLKIIFSNALPSVGSGARRDEDAFLPTLIIRPPEFLDAGSEKPTLEEGKTDNLKRATKPEDFYKRRKVFLIPSRRIFWGKGTVISVQGRKILSTMASFLKEMSNRVVISESTQKDDKDSQQFGLSRAWAVMEYLTTKQGLNKERFSLSATSTVAQENFKSSKLEHTELAPGPEPDRVLEIVLLERSVYN